MRNVLVFLIIIYWGNYSFAQNSGAIQKGIQQFVSDTDFKHSAIGIHIIRLSDAKVLGTYDAQKSLATASTLKVLTTATALLQRGAEFRYKTQVAYTGKIKLGVLYGDLVIKGCGDPTFNSKYFSKNNAVQRVVDLIKRKEISQINGDIILDISNFSSEIPATWTWEDIGNYYGTAFHPINYADNTYTINFQTKKVGIKSKILSVTPKQHLKFENKVIASKENADKAYIFGSPFSRERLITGTLPQFRKSFLVKGAMPNPEITFGEQLKETLQRKHIRILGKLKLGVRKTQHILGDILSPKLQEIITKTNQHSINLFAEAMLYLMKEGKNYQREDLVNELVQFWKSKGLNTEGLYLHDGSGLSHFNTVTPVFFTEMLRYMANTPEANIFKESLAVSGKSGTLKYLGKGTRLVGKVQGKSGSMRQVCSYVGYMTTQKGEKVAFAILLNNFAISHTKVRQKITRMLLDW